MAAKTIANFIEKASLLYEQKRSAVLAATALEMYDRRWLRWAWNGLAHFWHFRRGEWVGGQPRQPGSRLFYPGLSTPIRAIRRSRRTRIRAIRRGRRLSGVGVWRRKYWRLRCLFKNLAKGLGGDPKSSMRRTLLPIWTRLVRSWAASRHGAR